MIFVTVGSTFFNPLIEVVDGLAAEGFFGEEVVCQIGSGQYHPKHCRYFAFTDQFDRYLETCTLLITHGGMTVLEGIWRGKCIIAVANPIVAGGMQASFLKQLSDRFGLVWTDDPTKLRVLFSSAKNLQFAVSEPHIAKYMEDLSARRCWTRDNV